jgi:hypothetical protein
MTSKSTDRSNKWDSEFTEEKLQDQIKAAKSKWKELRFKVAKVEYQPFNGYFYLYFTDGEGQEDIYTFEKNQIKVLENVEDSELVKIAVLGDRAIQLEELNIQIGVEELLYGLQTINNWLKGIK